MVHHHAALRGQQRRQDVRQARGRQMHFDVPAQRIDARQQRAPAGQAQVRHGQPDQVQPDADHARLGQRQQMFGGDAGRHHRDAAQARGRGAQGLDQVAVVGPQETGLHQHAVAEPVRVQQGEVVGRRGVVVGAVAARGGQRQPAVEYVGVGVDGFRLGACVHKPGF